MCDTIFFQKTQIYLNCIQTLLTKSSDIWLLSNKNIWVKICVNNGQKKWFVEELPKVVSMKVLKVLCVEICQNLVIMKSIDKLKEYIPFLNTYINTFFVSLDSSVSFNIKDLENSINQSQ